MFAGVPKIQLAGSLAEAAYEKINGCRCQQSDQHLGEHDSRVIRYKWAGCANHRPMIHTRRRALAGANAAANAAVKKQVTVSRAA